jgi:hypothetical protein
MIDFTNMVTGLLTDLMAYTGSKSHPNAETLLAAFKGVNDYSPDGIMACWKPDGVYDNPMVGQAAVGHDAVRQCMVNLVNTFKPNGQYLVVDRLTEGKSNIIAEWHVEPRDGRRGVHVADFSDDHKLVKVTVYPRAS